MTVEFSVELDDGKYTYERLANGEQRATRYGERWKELVGDKFVAAMGYAIEDLQGENAILRAQNEGLIQSIEAARTAMTAAPLWHEMHRAAREECAELCETAWRKGLGAQYQGDVFAAAIRAMED